MASPAADVHLGDCVRGMGALADASVDLVIADPPYDIGVQDSPWDSVPHYLDWSRTWLAEAWRVLRPGGQLFIYGSPAKLWIDRLKIVAADEFGFDFKQHISWCYKQGGDSRFTGMVQYAVRMEHLEWFVKPAAKGTMHTFNAEAAAEHYSAEERAEALAKGVGRVTDESLSRGRPPRNWVEIPRENSRSLERKYGAHPSMKPLKLCERLVAVHSNVGDRVVIPFGGSGSEVVAAAKLLRAVVCFESAAEYHAIILRRLEGHGVRVNGGELGAGAGSAGQQLYPVLPAPPAEETTPLGQIERSAMFMSGYNGVFRHGKDFVAKIRLKGKLVYIGKYPSALEAAVAYQARAATEGALPAPRAAGGASEKKRGRPSKQDVLARAALGQAALGQAALGQAALAAPSPTDLIASAPQHALIPIVANCGAEESARPRKRGRPAEVGAQPHAPHAIAQVLPFGGQLAPASAQALPSGGQLCFTLEPVMAYAMSMASPIVWPGGLASQGPMSDGNSLSLLWNH
jgi:site-specific DNA-methyltransferase (adenine-specific)